MRTISIQEDQTIHRCHLAQDIRETPDNCNYIYSMATMDTSHFHDKFIQYYSFFNLSSLRKPPTPNYRQKDKTSLFNKLKAKTEDYLDLADNWDQSNGTAPQSTTVKDAILLLDMIKDVLATHPPHISVTGDNEICFEWRRKANVFYMFFRGKKTFNVMYKINGERNYQGGNPIAPTGIPNQFIKTIERVFADE